MAFYSKFWPDYSGHGNFYGITNLAEICRFVLIYGNPPKSWFDKQRGYRSFLIFIEFENVNRLEILRGKLLSPITNSLTRRKKC